MEILIDMIRVPAISIVIPAYNTERFIERTLRSVLQQTFTDFELILVNDGSTDCTRDLAGELMKGDNRCRIVDRSNGGLSRARNLGLRESRGEFVAFLDADDLWHPTKLSCQIAALKKETGRRAAAVYALFRVIDIDDRVLTKLDDRPSFSGYMLARHLYGRAIGNGSSLLVRRSIALRVGGFDPVCDLLGGCEDWDFEVKIARRHPIAVVPQYLVGYRLYQGNMSSNGLRMVRAVLEVTSKHLRQNSHLPTWVKKKVMAAAIEYAIGIMLEENRWTLLAKNLPQLIGHDPVRGLSMILRVLNRMLRNLSWEPKSSGLDPGNLPNFYELATEPRPPVEKDRRFFLNRRLRDRKILDRLARVDDALEEQLDQIDEEFCPESSQPLLC